jgi:hypothetical protein
MSNAYAELLEYLEDGETVENIVFGEFGWGSNFNEPQPYPVPETMQGTLMSLEDAKPLMDGWQFDGGYGAAECYPVYVWTNKRVIFVSEYDGSTHLNSLPRHPEACHPNFA